MHRRAVELIDRLQLAPHPEGGYFRQIFRSTGTVAPDDGRGTRAALTTIYFLLTAGDLSCWHRVSADEAWHFYEGAPLELWTADGDFGNATRHLLGPLVQHAAPVHVVPAGEWQAAASLGDYTLVGCSVGPGFEFADFEMLRDQSLALVSEVRARADLSRFV